MIKILEHLEGYISEHVHMAKTLLSLIKCEAKLAGQSIVPLVLTSCVLMVILGTVWLSAMILAGYYLLVLSGSFAVACSIILALNVLILLILIKYLSYTVKNMSFVNTREFFSQNERNDHELTKKDESRDTVDNRAIKKTTTSITNP